MFEIIGAISRNRVAIGAKRSTRKNVVATNTQSPGTKKSVKILGLTSKITETKMKITKLWAATIRLYQRARNINSDIGMGSDFRSSSPFMYARTPSPSVVENRPQKINPAVRNGTYLLVSAIKMLPNTNPIVAMRTAMFPVIQKTPSEDRRYR